MVFNCFNLAFSLFSGTKYTITTNYSNTHFFDVRYVIDKVLAKYFNAI